MALGHRRPDRARARRPRNARTSHVYTPTPTAPTGARGATAELAATGWAVNHKRVGRLMRRLGIAGLHLRKKVRTTIPEPAASSVTDLLERDFTAVAPGPRCAVGDVQTLDYPLRRGLSQPRPAVVGALGRRCRRAVQPGCRAVRWA
ncbi:transposase [Actinocrinis puniceicyclus]|uniref:Transposase n=1 Tax=Actinocrinis puniceicyclus TaxID=977794 RepID=A0A8J7WWF1_9ACTN|nr:transposase [Actinocrinis puniceicyclus]